MTNPASRASRTSPEEPASPGGSASPAGPASPGGRSAPAIGGTLAPDSGGTEPQPAAPAALRGRTVCGPATCAPGGSRQGRCQPRGAAPGPPGSPARRNRHATRQPLGQ